MNKIEILNDYHQQLRTMCLELPARLNGTPFMDFYLELMHKVDGEIKGMKSIRKICSQFDDRGFSGNSARKRWLPIIGEMFAQIIKGLSSVQH